MVYRCVLRVNTPRMVHRPASGVGCTCTLAGRWLWLPQDTYYLNGGAVSVTAITDIALINVRLPELLPELLPGLLPGLLPDG